MQLETVDPANRGLAAGGSRGEDFVLADARVLADRPGGGVAEADPGASTELRMQIDDEGSQHSRQQCDEAGVADQRGERAAQLLLDVLNVECLEGPIARLLQRGWRW
jgi:hypothetical protein